MPIFIAKGRMATNAVADQERANYESHSMACISPNSVMHRADGLV